jgi:hypothetical protein
MNYPCTVVPVPPDIFRLLAAAIEDDTTDEDVHVKLPSKLVGTLFIYGELSLHIGLYIIYPSYYLNHFPPKSSERSAMRLPI